MKTSAVLVLLSAISASAFVPVQKPAYRKSLELSVKAAESKEEDLEMTRKVIAQFLGDDVGGGEEEEAPGPNEKKESKDE